MKKLILFFILLLLSISANANISYDLVINKSGYVLKMDMVFKKEIPIQKVVSALKNGELLSVLSPNVVSVLNTPLPEGKYHSLMHVKSFGIHSNLLSMCEDKFNDTAKAQSWMRSCSLQTREMDGGKYMEWKGDEVNCSVTNTAGVICHFEIKGLPKPLKVFGFQIISPEIFSVKAKVQAMSNFFKLYFYIQDYSLSTKLALEKFEVSSLKKELDRFEEEAKKEIKSSGVYHHRYFMKDIE
jgi:hypothetical protein